MLHTIFSGHGYSFHVVGGREGIYKRLYLYIVKICNLPFLDTHQKEINNIQTTRILVNSMSTAKVKNAGRQDWYIYIILDVPRNPEEGMSERKMKQLDVDVSPPALFILLP